MSLIRSTNLEMMRELVACLLIWSSVQSSAQSNNLRFVRLGTEDGLSHTIASTVYQDKYGFIWVGTDDGLNRYNGYEFEIFRNVPQDSNSISDNRIQSIAEGPDGMLWVGTSNGLNRYDPTNGKFYRFVSDEDSIGALSGRTVSKMFYDRDGVFWLATEMGLAIYDHQREVFQNFLIPNESGVMSNVTVNGIAEDKDGVKWLATSIGVISMEGRGEGFVNHTALGKTSSKNTISIFIDSENRLWAGHFNSGVSLLDLNTGLYRFFLNEPDNDNSISNNYVYQTEEDEHGQIWVCTDNGLNRYLGSGRFMSYHNEPGNEESLSSNIVNEILFDRQNRMWVTTRLGGVCFYDEAMYKFNHIRSNPLDPQSLSSNKIGGYTEGPPGRLIVGTDGAGVNFYDRVTNTFEQLRRNPDNPNNTLSSDKILALEYDRYGGLWLGTWGGGLNFYNERTGQIRNYRHDPNDPNSITDDNIFSIFEDSNGNVWVGSWGNGLSKYNRDTDDFKQFPHTPGDPNSISGTAIYGIQEDAGGNLWFAMESTGLEKFDPVSETFTNFNVVEGENSISSNDLVSIHIDSEGYIWAGTNGGGVNRYDPESDVFKAYTLEDGLPNNVVNGILEDNDGFIWMSTNNGLSRFDPETETFTNYRAKDGLQDNQFMPRNSLKMSTGELVFGGNNGFNMFDPTKLTKNQTAPPVYITDFSLFNEKVQLSESGILRQNPMFTKEIELNYDQNFFSFDYTAINYTNAESNTYQYILEGLNEDWVNIGNDRRVSFTDVDPGSYIFKVKAANNDGIWNETPASMTITIVPPFWATWWFRILSAIIVIGGVTYLYRRQINQERKNQRLLEERIQISTSQIKDQNDELQEQKDNLQKAVEETNYVLRQAIESGKFSEARISVDDKTGSWKELGQMINQLFDTILEPFSGINEIVDAMAHGDLTKRYTRDARGDVHNLTQNLNKALDNLSELLEGVSGSVDKIGEASAVMASTGEEMGVNSGEIAAAIAQMSSGAQSQVTKVDESSNLIEGIVNSSAEMGEQAKTINDAAKHGVQLSQDGKGLIDKVSISIEDLIRYSQESNEAITMLTQRADDITRALSIIKDIAAQTNLLALNAAIEAAQAGDAGRGFAVVAEEVRKLAEDSKNSTKEIESMVGHVQEATRTTANLIDRMNQSVKEGGAASGDAAKSFQEIANSYSETLMLSENIVAATRQQTDDVKQVLSITESIVVIAEQTAAGTEEVATSSAELSSGMDNFNSNTGEVSRIVDELRKKVSHFNLKKTENYDQVLSNGSNGHSS